METLHTRLDYRKDRVLKVTETFGRLAAMEEFEVNDYVCFSKWLEGVTGNENFGIHPKISLNGGPGVVNAVAIKVVRTLLDLQVENEELRKENRQLKLELSHDGGTEREQALALLDVCQV